MTCDEFANLLRQATKSSIDLAARYVENDLPQTARYNVLLNQSYDGHATPDDLLYPADNDRECLNVTEQEVVRLLCRDGRCPAWIDVSVVAQSSANTLVCLQCCGRYTDNLSKMYYTASGLGPFGVKSPVLPRGFVEGSKFRLPVVTDCV